MLLRCKSLTRVCWMIEFAKKASYGRCIDVDRRNKQRTVVTRTCLLITSRKHRKDQRLIKYEQTFSHDLGAGSKIC